MNSAGDVTTISVVSFFQRLRRPTWPHESRDLATRVSTMVGLPLTHVSVDYEGERTGLSKQKGYRYGPRAVEALQNIFGARPLTSLWFYCARSSDLFHDSDFVMSVWPTAPTRLRSAQFYAELPRERVALCASEEIAALILRESDSIADVAYGLGTVMPRDKYPAVYFNDIFNPNLSGEDVAELESWITHRWDYGRRTRGVYLANLLGTRHLEAAGDRGEFQRDLEGLLGQERLTWLSSGRLVFQVPPALLETSDVRGLFPRRGLLMRGD